MTNHTAYLLVLAVHRNISPPHTNGGREVRVVPDRGDVIEHELVTEPGQEGEAGHREQRTEGGEVSQHCLAFNHGSLTSSGMPLLSLIG